MIRIWLEYDDINQNDDSYHGHILDDVTDLDALVAGVDADHEADEHLRPVASQEAGQQHSDQTWWSELCKVLKIVVKQTQFCYI